MNRIELKPDRSLLDPNFESYKLSLDALPVFNTGSVDVVSQTPAEEQYSYVHAKLFSQNNNHLVRDPFTGSVYVVDANAVSKVLYGGSGGAPVQVQQVWQVSAGLRPARSGDYNASLVFASDSLAIFANGSGVAFILDTGVRNDGDAKESWRPLFHEEICGTNRTFVVVSAVASETTGEAERVLHCLMQYVEAKDRVEGFDHGKHLDDGVNFVNVIEWMTFAAAGPTCWGLDRVRRFVFIGGLEYAQLTSTGSHMVCSTSKPFFAVFDSTGTLEEDAETGRVERKEPVRGPPPFYWLQSVEDMGVWVVLPEDANKKQIKVTLKPRELSVLYQGKEAVSGRTWDVLDSDSLTWTIQKGKLEINLSKANEGLMWQRFLAHGSDDKPVIDGEEINNPDAVDAIEKEFRELAAESDPATGMQQAYNSQELEDCDAFPEEGLSLHVIDGATNKATKWADLSGHQWLFNTQVGSASASPKALTRDSLCLRHDVDGLVWEVVADDADAGSVNLAHNGTFSAIGYVQASKEQRKFTAAAPDLSYVAICDRTRHVYIYRQPSAISDGCDLRNRRSGQRVKQISKQQVRT